VVLFLETVKKSALRRSMIPPIESENLICATLRGHLSNNWALFNFCWRESPRSLPVYRSCLQKNAHVVKMNKPTMQVTKRHRTSISCKEIHMNVTDSSLEGW